MKQMDAEWISRLGSSEDFNIFHRAPTVLIVSGRKDATTPLVDCAAAVQNILLAAESMDIGSCWIGFARFYFINPGNMKKFKIPEDHEVYFGVSLGYKISENPKTPERNHDVYTYFR